METIKSIRLECIDINGIARGLLLDKDYYIQKADVGYALYSGLLSAFSFDGKPVKNSDSDKEKFTNSYMYPDKETFRQLPWKPHVGCILGDLHLKSNDLNSASCSISPRSICKTQIKRLLSMGMQLYGAFEYEFYTVSDDFLPAVKLFNYSATKTSLWAEDLAIDIMQNLKRMSITPENYHSEYGPSQQEITMKPAFGLNCPDNATRFKQTVHEISKMHGYKATFMSKPFLDQSGSSGHFNHSLWSMDGENLFYDVTRPNKLSEVAEHWIAGLRYHSNALMALYCPTTNCYERITPGTFTPLDNSWGIDDRTVAYRVKNLDSSQTYVENRISGAAANQYLVVAGSIIAGLDGIRNKMSLETLKDVDKKEIEKNENLPRSLQDALNILLKSDLFKSELGDDFFRAFEDLKNLEISITQEAKDVGNVENWYRDFYGFCI